VPTLNGAAVSSELLKIKGDVKKKPEEVKHSDSDHPQGISPPSFILLPCEWWGRRFLSHSNIEAVRNK